MGAGNGSAHPWLQARVRRCPLQVTQAWSPHTQTHRPPPPPQPCVAPFGGWPQPLIKVASSGAPWLGQLLHSEEPRLLGPGASSGQVPEGTGVGTESSC